MMSNTSKVVFGIEQGAYDGDLRMLLNTVENRKQAIKSRNTKELEEGNKVRITQCRPRYMIGKLAKVVRVNRTRVVIKLFEDASSRFRMGMDITVPSNCVELAD